MGFWRDIGQFGPDEKKSELVWLSFMHYLFMQLISLKELQSLAKRNQSRAFGM